MTSILERDGAQHSATTTRRDLESPAAQLHQAVLRYNDTLGYAAEEALDPRTRATLEARIEAIWPGLTREAVYPTLRTHLALHALNGHDPMTLLLQVASTHPIDPSSDRAAVLDWRLDTAAEPTTGGPLPWLDTPPTAPTVSQEWRTYLHARADRVRCLADAVHQDAARWSPAQAPRWASGLNSPTNADLRGDLAVWRAAFDIPDTDLRPTGRHQPAGSAARHRRHLNHRLRAPTHQQRPTQDSGLLQMIPDVVTTDPGYDVLTQRLQTLTHAGVEVTHLLQKVMEKPLPQECAAAALWWRVVRHLGPAALPASGLKPSGLHPDWIPALAARLGTETTDRVMADTAWPALVAAIHARPHDWTAEQLIDSITATHKRAPGNDVGAEDLCTALIWRVATMTDPPTDDHEEPNDPIQVTPAASVASKPLPLQTQTRPDAPDGITRDRIIELNHQALDFYTDTYTRSWAPAYLVERIGTDLTEDPRFRCRLRAPRTDQPDPSPHQPRSHRHRTRPGRTRAPHRRRADPRRLSRPNCFPYLLRARPRRLHRPEKPHQGTLPLRRTQVPQHPHHPCLHQEHAPLRPHRSTHGP